LVEGEKTGVDMEFLLPDNKDVGRACNERVPRRRKNSLVIRMRKRIELRIVQ